MLTAWGEDLDPDHVLQEYPRPQLVRDSYLNLNGRWEYAITPADVVAAPAAWDGEILVPFSPEAPLSGVGRTLQPDQALWYHRTVTLPAGFRRDRVLLHFGAVDQTCEVWIDGARVGEHTGGYLPFTLDVTEALGDAPAELLVRVRDVTDRSWHARGKQSLAPQGIWYTAQSGIWQTVWMESVPSAHVERLVLTPHLDSAEVEVTVESAGSHPADVRILDDGAEVARATLRPGVPQRIRLGAPVRPWSPEDPHLYDVHVSLGADSEADEVTSYVAMRSFGRGPDARGVSRLLLNGEPYLHAGLLDQGYWPDGLYTAPSDAALADDVARAKAMGFTMLRKHIKIEPLRWYHHCDRLGMLVWQDFVNGGGSYDPKAVQISVVSPVGLTDDAPEQHRRFGRDDAAGRAAFLAEAEATVELLRSVPSIALWVPFNEAWGQFDAADVAARVRAWDPTRLVDHASGWHDQGAGDLASRHVYFRRHYRLDPADVRDERVAALTEYGGYSHRVSGHCWSDQEFGYKRFPGRFAFERAFLRLHHAQLGPAIEVGLGAYVYTQLADVEQETNGLLTYDRRVDKIDPAVVRAANRRLRQRFEHAVGGPARSMPVAEREITEPVSLTRPGGMLDPAAVGWTRTPLHDTDGVTRLGRGRTKRWEYWALTTPTHVVSLVVSDLDYAAVHGLYVLDRRTGEQIAHDAVGLRRSVTLPGSLGTGPARARTRALSVEIDEVQGGTRLRAAGPRLRLDVVAQRPPGHECLGVVVPWSAREFQYTVKDVARPATGWLEVDGARHSLPADHSFATLDHGRGRWPYDVHWNWGAGSGRVDGRVVGLQLGGRWTDGTGTVENALVVDGRLSKISEELVWEYSPGDWLAPWRVRGDAVDVAFTPEHLRRAVTNLLMVSSRTHQCFGTWRGRVRDEHGTWVPVDGLVGWAEDVRNRW